MPDINLLSRRHTMKVLAQAAWLPAVAQFDAHWAEAATDQLRMNRFPRMVQEFFVAQAREAENKHRRRLRTLNSREEALAYVKSAQQRCRESFGPNPERTPLNARITGTVDRDQYQIENVIFDSRPGFPVTANLY